MVEIEEMTLQDIFVYCCMHEYLRKLDELESVQNNYAMSLDEWEEAIKAHDVDRARELRHKSCIIRSEMDKVSKEQFEMRERLASNRHFAAIFG